MSRARCHTTQRCIVVQSILYEFESRFTDFASTESVTSYMCDPFGNIDVDDMVSRLVSMFQLDHSGASKLKFDTAK